MANLGLERILLEIATNYRNAIVRSNVLPNFPIAMCSCASMHLARHLVDYCNADPERIFIRAGAGAITHKWLEVEGVHIDITASQPALGKPEVFVWSNYPWEGILNLSDYRPTFASQNQSFNDVEYRTIETFLIPPIEKLS